MAAREMRPSRTRNNALAAALPPDYLRLVANSNAAGDTVHFPDMADLVGRLHFSTREGRIWLDDERMLLIQARALGWLRREMIESVGIDAARRLFTRMGYQAGAHAPGRRQQE
mgnify:FL=1